MALFDFLRRKKGVEKSSSFAKATADKKKPVEIKTGKISVAKKRS